jgi:anti-sigma-K factor RskA
VAEDPTIGVDERLLDDAALEALAETCATPPRPALRARVLAAARQDALLGRRAAALQRWRLTGAAAATVALALGGLLARESRQGATLAGELAALGQQNRELAAQLAAQGRTLAGLREALATQAHVVRVLAGPRTLSAALAPTPQGGAASGRVMVDPASGETAVVVAGLGPAPAGRVYALWAIRGERPPEPAGLFAGSAEGPVTARTDTVVRPAEVTAFAVSIEPAGGSPSPTGPVVLAGPVAG